MPEYYQLLFKLITESVFAECSDGDAVVECKYISKEIVSAAFAEWIQANGITHLKKYDFNDVINYSDGSNENFIFLDYKEDNGNARHIPTWTTVRITI